jgi:hypothetical protein
VLLRRRMQQMEEDRWRRVEQFEAEQDEFLEKQRQKKEGQEH